MCVCVCVSVTSFETFGSGSLGGPLGGPVGFGGPLGVRPEPRGRRRRPAGAPRKSLPAPELKSPIRPQGALMGAEGPPAREASVPAPQGPRRRAA